MVNLASMLFKGCESNWTAIQWLRKLKASTVIQESISKVIQRKRISLSDTTHSSSIAVKLVWFSYQPAWHCLLYSVTWSLLLCSELLFLSSAQVLLSIPFYRLCCLFFFTKVSCSKLSSCCSSTLFNMLMSHDYIPRIMDTLGTQCPSDKNDVTDEIFLRIVRTNGCYQNLLDVSRCCNLSPGIFQNLNVCVTLQYLDISYTTVDDLSFLEYCVSLKGNLMFCFAFFYLLYFTRSCFIFFSLTSNF